MIVLYTNIDTITNKMPELLAKIAEVEAKVVIVTEVSPKNFRYKLTKSELSIKNFQLFCNIEDGGRGVCIYVHSSLKANVSTEISRDVIDTKFVEISNGKFKSFLLGVVYRSPNASVLHSQTVNDLIEALHTTNKNLLLVGDFNYPQIDWIKKISKASNTHPSSRFLQCCSNASLTQLVEEPTRVKNGEASNLLDLVLTNCEDAVKNVTVNAPIGKSDHVCLIISIFLGKKKDPLPKHFFNYNKGDYIKLRKILGEINWSEEFGSCKNVEEMWRTFSKLILSARNTCVPLVVPDNKYKERPPWMRKCIIASVKAKHKAYRKWKKMKCSENYHDYCKKRNLVTKSVRRAVKDYERSVTKNVKTNPKQFWNFIKSKTKYHDQVSSLETTEGIYVTDEDKAQVLNKAFSEVFVDEDINSLPASPTYDIQIPMEEVVFTEEDILSKIQSVNVYKAWGPDDLHPKVLKECSAQIKYPLHLIFTESLNKGEVPCDWKKANVSAVYKKGNKHSPLNYRPISLTSVVCKIFESIIRDQIMEHLLVNNLLNANQHGFVPKRSCMTQQIEVLEKWTKEYDLGRCVDVAFMDIKKAYDTVPHKRLVLKLKSFGFESKLLNWIDAFLSNRLQRVVINSEFSQWAKVKSGVPQGSVLGPVLFLCYINDLPDGVKSELRLFADDTKLFSTINNITDCLDLQNDLDALCEWSTKWKLNFHPQKCSILRLGKNPPGFTYKMKDEDGHEYELSQTETVKDLGVTIDRQLTFTSHVDNIVSDANKLVGLIRRCITSLDKQTFLLLFKTLIRPKLEYNNSVWWTLNKCDLVKLESVQRRATKLIPGLRNLSYTERLRALSLPSLQYRILRGDCIQVYKYLNGYFDVDWSNLFCLNNMQHHNTRGHGLKLTKLSHSTRIRGKSFTVRVINSWNALPQDVVCASSLNAFKNALDDHWEVLPIKFDPDIF